MTVSINRLATVGAAAVLIGTLAFPATATAATNSAVTSVPFEASAVEMHVTANCAGDRCTFNTSANLLAPEGPIGFPGDTWARQTITLRSTNRDAWQEASYSAPAGAPRVVKGANNDNILSKQLKSINKAEISATYFGGGPIERFTIDGDSQPIDWASGRPTTKGDFIVCSVIQVVRGGVNVTTPSACAQTGF